MNPKVFIPLELSMGLGLGVRSWAPDSVLSFPLWLGYSREGLLPVFGVLRARIPGVAHST